MRVLLVVFLFSEGILLSFLFTSGLEDDNNSDGTDLQTGCKTLSPNLIRCYDVTLKDPDNFDRSIETLKDILLQVSETDSRIDLEIINCDVSYFPDSFLKQSNISGLYFFFNYFESFPEEFLMDVNLKITTLELTGNEIDNLDEVSFHQMPIIPNLQAFTLRHTNIMDINMLHLRSFTNLEMIDLSDNSIRVLPRHAFQGLDQLKLIDLKENRLNKLRRETFSDLPSLTYLDLSGNELFMVEMGTFVRLENLRYLGLEHNILLFFEETALNDKDQPNLEFVTLGGNNIRIM